MSSLKIINNNILDTADTITATSTAPGFDISNTRIDTKSKTWRSDNQVTAQQIVFTWSAPQIISGAAIAFSNFDLSSTFKVILEDLPTGGSVLFDSGDQSMDFSYDLPAGFDSMSSDSFPYGGGSCHSLFFDEFLARKLTFEVESIGNADGFIEISRLISGKALSPFRTAAYGASVAYMDATKSIRTDAGDLVADRGTIHKKINFQLGAMDNQDRALLNKVFLRNGRSQPVFVSLVHAIGGELEKSFQIYGKLESEIGSELFSFNLHRSNISIVEV